MRRTIAALVAVVVALSFAAPRVRASDAEAPIRVKATVDDKDVAFTGWFKLKLAFTAQEDVKKAYSLTVVIADGSRTLATLRPAPPTPTSSWKKGATASQEIEAPFPTDADLGGATSLGIWLGFVDAETGDTLPPADSPSGSHWGACVAEIAVPKPPGDADAVLAAAEAMSKAGRTDDAWNTLVTGARQAEGDPTKYRFRDALLRAGGAAPALSAQEEAVVAQRIADERTRFLRQEAGRFYDRKQWHAALRVLEAIGGTLAEQADKAVLGAVKEASRVEKDAQDVRERLVESIAKEEQAEADAAIKTLGMTRELLKRAEEWRKAGKFAMARYALNKLYRGEDGRLGQEVYGKLKETEKAWIAATPPEEQALVDAALRHPSFARTGWSVSREFIFIGPKSLVDGISAQSRLHYDLAYVFLTDLFGRKPNPGGDRVTVYFKELWDFGGGVGGGKTIDIGNAKPDAKDVRVDTGLLYHELTHCVDDTDPIYEGFREGLANFGAAYCLEVMGQTGDSQHSFQSNLDAFRRDYVARDLEYWRIPNYGPSAGFFLHFVDKYAKTKTGHDWAPCRRFFRGYRALSTKEGREPLIVRAMARELVAAFGPGAFDDLVAFRFPLVPADREAIEREVDAYARGEGAVMQAATELADSPNSPLPREAAQGRMIQDANAADDEGARKIGREELGVIYDWRGIGPFEQKDADPGAFPFPPEYEIDFAKEYPGRGNVCRWQEARAEGAVKIDALGWVTFDYSYQDQTSSYALTHVTVPAETQAWAWFRADDDLTLFVDGELAGTFDYRLPLSSLLWWRGPQVHVADSMRLPVTLHAGRNRLLVKVRNRGGPSGFTLALCRRDGKPIAGLVADKDAPSPAVARRAPPPEDHWKRIAKHEFASKPAAPWIVVAAGRFDVVNKALVGEATDKGVEWRKYTVRPGFPKDAPSNLAWFAPKTTEGLDAFRLTLQVETPKGQAPKLTVTFQGDGERDGLAGWTLILRGAGDGKAKASLERYDRQVYESAALDFAWAEAMPLVVSCEARRVTARLADAALLTDVPIDPIAGKNRIGFATWGGEPRIAGFDLCAPKK